MGRINQIQAKKHSVSVGTLIPRHASSIERDVTLTVWR